MVLTMPKYFGFNVAIFRLSKTIHEEAITIFYSWTAFGFSIPYHRITDFPNTITNRILMVFGFSPPVHRTGGFANTSTIARIMNVEILLHLCDESHDER